jgi:hypothetical protein
LKLFLHRSPAICNALFGAPYGNVACEQRLFLVQSTKRIRLFAYGARRRRLFELALHRCSSSEHRIPNDGNTLAHTWWRWEIDGFWQ